MAAAEMKNRDNIGENVYLGILAVADYESVIRFSKYKIGFKMAAAEMKNGENVYLRVFEDADYESVIRFSKFEMADSRWRPPK